MVKGGQGNNGQTVKRDGTGRAQRGNTVIRGLLAGGAWGALISFVMVTLTSQIANWRDLTPGVTEEIAAAVPQSAAPETTSNGAAAPVVVEESTPETPTPQVGEGDAQAAVTPPQDTDPPAQPAPAEVAEQPQAPDTPSDVAEAPGSDTTIAQAPAAPDVAAPQAPADAAIRKPAPLAPRVPPADAPDAPEAPLIAEASPQAPAGDAAPRLSVRRIEPAQPTPEPAAPPAPEAPAPAPQPAAVEEAAVAPDVAGEPATPGAEDTAPPAAAAPEPSRTSQPDATPAPEAAPTQPARTNRLPVVRTPGQDGTARSGIPAPSVRTNRLPRIGDPVEEGAAPVEDAVVEEVPAGPEGTALARNSVPFEAPADVPRLSVVLVHEGDGLTGATDLSDLPVPVSFAVSATASDAGDAARLYRAGGHEVALIPALPRAGRAQDVEVALADSLRIVPDAVALMDPTGQAFQNSRVGLAQVILAATDTGHGVVTVARGLNSAQQIAERQGVPAGIVFRALDPSTDRFALARALDQAAFRARQDGNAILVAPADPEVLAALVEWALENRTTTVVLAPLSAVLVN